MSSRWNALFLAVGSLITLTTASAATAPTIIIDEHPLLDAHLLFGALLGASLMLLYQPLRYQPNRNIGYISFILFILIVIAVCLWNNAAEFSFLLLVFLFVVSCIFDKRYKRASPAKKSTTAPASSDTPQHTPDSIRKELITQLEHEVRTPLNGILGMTELLLDMPLSERQRDYVQTIQCSGNALLSQLNSLFLPTETNTTSLDTENVKFDLYALFDDCISTVKARATQQQVEIIKLLPPAVPRHIRGDLSLFRRALLELLEHALRRSATSSEIALLAGVDTQDPTQLRIVIRDNGLPSDHNDSALDNIRRSVRELKGHFGIENSIQGVTHWFSIPLITESQSSPSIDPYIVLQDARILIVSADETAQKVLQQLCSSWNMEVVIANKAMDALALLRVRSNLQEPFDLVLLEQDIPGGISGLQLAARIRSDALIEREMPLIMMGNPQQESLLIPARNADINYVLTKPVAGYALKATLAEALGRKRKQPKLSAAELLLPHAQQLRILVAEDNSISTKVTLGMLQRLGIQPELVSNGEEALQRLYNQRYDLVLMDCEMPVLDGFTTTKRLREWEKRYNKLHTPVIALTAHALTEYRDRALAAGMDGHLAKPVDLLQLRQMIERWTLAPAL